MTRTPILSRNYRVIPDAWARGYFYGTCKVCPDKQTGYVTARSMNTLLCEKAVVAHLKDKHGIEEEA